MLLKQGATEEHIFVCLHYNRTMRLLKLVKKSAKYDVPVTPNKKQVHGSTFCVP